LWVSFPDATCIEEIRHGWQVARYLWPRLQELDADTNKLGSVIARIDPLLDALPKDTRLSARQFRALGLDEHETTYLLFELLRRNVPQFLERVWSHTRSLGELARNIPDSGCAESQEQGRENLGLSRAGWLHDSTEPSERTSRVLEAFRKGELGLVGELPQVTVHALAGQIAPAPAAADDQATPLRRVQTLGDLVELIQPRLHELGGDRTHLQAVRRRMDPLFRALPPNVALTARACERLSLSEHEAAYLQVEMLRRTSPVAIRNRLGRDVLGDLSFVLSFVRNRPSVDGKHVYDLALPPYWLHASGDYVRITPDPDGPLGFCPAGLGQPQAIGDLSLAHVYHHEGQVYFQTSPSVGSSQPHGVMARSLDGSWDFRYWSLFRLEADCRIGRDREVTKLPIADLPINALHEFRRALNLCFPLEQPLLEHLRARAIADTPAIARLPIPEQPVWVAELRAALDTAIGTFNVAVAAQTEEVLTAFSQGGNLDSLRKRLARPYPVWAAQELPAAPAPGKARPSRWSALRDRLMFY
jgi:hypothetical protein